MLLRWDFPGNDVTRGLLSYMEAGSSCVQIRMHVMKLSFSEFVARQKSFSLCFDSTLACLFRWRVENHPVSISIYTYPIITLLKSERKTRGIARTRCCLVPIIWVEKTKLSSSSFPPASVRPVFGGGSFDIVVQRGITVIVLVLFPTLQRYKEGSIEAGFGALENAAVLFTNYNRFSA